MNLNLSQIRDITTGAVRVEEFDDGIHFYRFTKQQEVLYKDRSDDFYRKTFSTSGVRIRFRTNSETLFLRIDVTGASSRSFFALDVFVNGEKTDTLDNFSGVELPTEYTKCVFPLGEFSKVFDLGKGEKEVCLYLPWSVKAVLKNFAIDEDSFIEPVKPGKKMLCFGDSITQGYDALYPSHKYSSRLADMLDAEEYNKAIGGEVFFPALASEKEDFDPDYITVAYGTNDWSCCTKQDFEHHCHAFFENLVANYPKSKIFAITPIWRKDHTEKKPFGEFQSVGEIIQKQTVAFDNVSVIQGFDFVPQTEDLFADLRLHPNDQGFEYYFENLAKRIKDIL